MKQTVKKILYCTFAAVLLWSCSSNDAADEPTDATETPITFDATYPDATRVSDNSFENGDQIGVFVALSSATLETGGNLVNNEALTFNSNVWTSNRLLYWDKGTYNAYAYYPYMQTISSISDLPFSVQTNQEGDGYEQSDFLHAKTSNIQATSSPVKLFFKHIMSKLTIRLVKGEDYEGELPDDATVLIHNTHTASTIDLSAGVATVNSRNEAQTITTHSDGDHKYSAIVVPQRITSRCPLIEVEIDGVSYLYESTFQFKKGMNHTVSLVISQNPDQVKIDIGGEVQSW